jgi:hypothetical protein
MEPRVLLHSSDKCFEVRVLVAPFDSGVQVVWHETVSKICEAHCFCRSQEMRLDQRDMGGDVKEGLPFVGAKGHEIAMRPKIVEAIKMFGVGMHADKAVQDGGQVNLPAEAGSHSNFRLKPEAT